MRLANILALASLAFQGGVHALSGRPSELFQPERRELLQDVVTFDNYSLLINGERLFIVSVTTAKENRGQLLNKSLYLVLG